MAMETRLTLRQTQRLVMTPMLQQAIHLLQLSTVELQDLIQDELKENPLLEEAPPDDAPDPEAPVEPDGPRAEAAVESPVTAEIGEPAPADLPFDISEVIFGPPEERTLVQQEEHEETRFENFVGTPTSLANHLDEQLRLSVVDADVRAAGEEIIGNVDEDGYLRATLEEIAEKRNLPVAIVEKALTFVQGLDPLGVAARDLRECLLIQLRAPGREPPASQLAVDILDHHFEALQRCKYPEIARALKVEQDRVIEAVHEIATLEPKPGRSFAPVETRYVVPDVLVKKVGDDYAIILNEDGMPRLRINSYYKNVIGQGDEARRYVEDRLRSAVWLIKSIQQRQKTLYKVTHSIVQFQREFLDKGLPYLRPLSLRDVAEDIRMHESTVSRVTTSKFVETPQGVLSLKFFFHSGIAKTQGDEVSSVSVKKMIEDLVAKEDLAKPLSDQDITKALRQEGLTIARRTVAKYREELGILPSHQRRLAVRKRT
ncbi:MAG TPA: RNA polymerase factor sigma-54 [Methylomirabilota bacterium]|jgi:RNA polymerase sigma-54 factor